MTQPTDPQAIAAKALAKCAAYDPWFPQPNRATVAAWSEQIQRYDLDLPDVLAGVSKMYADNGNGFRPLPKDLTDAARAIRADRCQRESAAELDARQTRQESTLESRNRLAAITAGFGKSVDDV